MYIEVSFSVDDLDVFHLLPGPIDLLFAVVQYGKEHAIQVGPWTVTAEFDDSFDSCLLEKKAFLTWEQLMAGSIDYYVMAPMNDTKPHPLVIIGEFTKQNRPVAWKLSDPKIQSTLPLLGNDECGMRALSCGENYAIAKVTLTLL